MIRSTSPTLVLVTVLVAACAVAGERNIRVDPPTQATQTTARTLSTVLLESGYQHLGLKDPVTGHHLQTVEEHGEYRMAFAATDNAAIQVFVSVNERSGKATLRFEEENRGPLSEQAESRFRALADRLSLEFGRENVTVR